MVSVAWECISGSSFGDLDQNSSITLLALHRFSPHAACDRTALFGPASHTVPSKDLLGLCHQRRMEGTRRVTLSIPGHIWDEHLHEMPTRAMLLLAFMALMSHAALMR